MNTHFTGFNETPAPIPEIPSPAVKAYIASYDLENRARGRLENTGNLQVSRAASTLAVIYERLRQVLEYHDEQVLRRRAIERILLRRLTSSKNADRAIAEGLIKEVTWAHYVANNSLPPERIEDVAQIIGRYKLLLERNAYRQTKKLPDLRDWIIGVMATEIEQKLVPHHTSEALAQLMFSTLDQSLTDLESDEATKNLQIYLAIQRSLLKADTAKLRFLLLNSYYPKWQDNDSLLTDQVATQFIQAVEAIEHHIKHPLGERLLPIIRRQTAPFNVIRSIVEENRKKSSEILAIADQREAAVKTICALKYKNIRSKIQRAAVRSIIYLFITKMTLAFVIEIPIDKFMYGEVRLLPLIINVLFPPFLMFLVAMTIRTPDNRNTERILTRVNTIVEDTDGKDSIRLIVPPQKRRSSIFLYVYIMTFAISFVITWYVLSRLHFNFVSKSLFFLFTCLVSFFSFRIRQTASEMVLMDDKESILTAIIDFFFLPFLRVGRWLSYGFSKINIFIYLFDFVLEAPLKSIIAVFEEWFSFIREKKDELL